jgi:hypothetical protein
MLNYGKIVSMSLWYLHYMKAHTRVSVFVLPRCVSDYWISVLDVLMRARVNECLNKIKHRKILTTWNSRCSNFWFDASAESLVKKAVYRWLIHVTGRGVASSVIKCRMIWMYLCLWRSTWGFQTWMTLLYTTAGKQWKVSKYRKNVNNELVLNCN